MRTLEERDGRLVQIGAVGGLGEGERIFAVRFIDDTAFVVTFRQTDPLFTIDLSNPRAPRKVGELHVNGYSAYLHPVGDGRLLGIGRDADDQGNTRGLQLSLFDVSDLAHPRRLARQTLADDTLQRGRERPPRVPVVGAGAPGRAPGRDLRLGAQLRRRARLPRRRRRRSRRWRASRIRSTSDWAPAFRRSVVVGDRLVLVSDTGVLSTPLAAPADAPFVSFP